MLRPDQFEQTFKLGIRITRKPVGLLFMQNQAGFPRLGLAISKKAVPLATRRNRLKRVARDEFRRAAHGFPAVDLVIYVQPGGSVIKSAEFRQILTYLWAKVAERCA